MRNNGNSKEETLCRPSDESNCRSVVSDWCAGCGSRSDYSARSKTAHVRKHLDERPRAGLIPVILRPQEAKRACCLASLTHHKFSILIGRYVQFRQSRVHVVHLVRSRENLSSRSETIRNVIHTHHMNIAKALVLARWLERAYL
jgi:hypothetical protein